MSPSHEELPSLELIKQKCWAGEYRGPDGAVALHVRRYAGLSLEERTPKELVAYASTLYSARKLMKGEAIALLSNIIVQLSRESKSLFDDEDADSLDVLSTVLWWWSQVTKQHFFGQCAVEVCDLGLELTEDEDEKLHTRTLLLTTSAIISRSPDYALHVLGLAAARAPRITDQNQKVRVYKRLAYGYAQRLCLIRALGWYREASRAAKSADPDTRAKLSPFG